MRREKTKFEKWFSFSRHKRRFGAKNISSSLVSTDFKSQRKQIIPGDKDKAVYTYGSTPDLNEHLANLRKEFAGQSELCYTHAKLLVLIRREFETEKHFKIFEQLWQKEKSFLLENLSVKWLMSSSATFIQYSNDDAIKGLGMACYSLYISINLQESERFITNAQDCIDDKKKIGRLHNNERISLFNGMPAYKFGHDDTLLGVRRALDKTAKINVTGEILLEMFERFNEYDTVFRRAKERNIRKKSEWW